MRILFINTYDVGGGAATIACRLSKVLGAAHSTENYHLAGTVRSESNLSISTRGPWGVFAEKVIDRLTNAVGAQYVFFPVSSRNIIRILKRLRPDVVSLHNTHGGYFQTDLLPRISAYAPIVWTLHDMWSFTGNAAHTFGNDSWKRMENDDELRSVYPAMGINTGAWLLRHKLRIYQRSRLTIVTPSRWLQTLAAQSPVFTGKDVVHIFNGLDLDIFRPREKAICRKSFAIPDEAPVVMFSAEHLQGNPWKGGEDLRSMLHGLDQKIKTTTYLLVVGKGELPFASQFRNLIVKHTGFLDSEERMVQCYSAADLFLYPTRADNLPNVLVEAIACGTPCVTFDVGGCTEIIQDGHNGLIISGTDGSSEVAALLEDPSRLARLSINARNSAVEKFSDKQMGESYFALFSSLLHSNV